MKSTGAKIGIIGCGSIGHVHARHAQHAGLDIAAVWDIKPEAAAKLASEVPSAQVMPSAEALLAQRDIAGVIIAVPNDLHMPLAVQSVQAGKHVLLEKPMALSTAQCDDIIRASEKAKKHVQMGFVCRQLPAVATAKKLAHA